jgi:hypothetical protein
MPHNSIRLTDCGRQTDDVVFTNGERFAVDTTCMRNHLTSDAVGQGHELTVDTNPHFLLRVRANECVTSGVL